MGDVEKSPVDHQGLLSFRVFGLDKGKNRDPTSGLEPLSCSLRVIHQALQRFAEACKSRISRCLSLLRVAGCCTVLRSQWYQGERQLHSDGGSNGTPSRPSEPQSE